MSNHARKAVFWTLLAVFFAAGVPLVLLSAGYRFRFDTLSLTRSGGLYVRSVPADAKIHIDGKPTPNNSGILSSGTFVTGLVPGKYELEVSKEGYHPFRATAEIIPLQADSFEKVVLAPTAYNPYLSGDVADFYVKNGEIITKDTAGKLRYNGQIIAGDKFEFFTADRKSAVTSVLRDGERVYFLISLSNPRVSTNINEIFWNLKSLKLALPGKVPIMAAAPHPYDSDKIILSTKAALYITDLKSLAITRNGEGVERMIQENSSVFLIRNGSLIGFNVTLKTSSPIMGIKDHEKISISPNGKKAAMLWNNKVLEVYDIDAKKSLRFDLKGLGDIKDIFWHKTSGYIFISSGNNLYFLYVEKENMEPQIIYENLEQARYSDGELFILSKREIKTSRF
jgi:hypothetical protein